MSWNEITVLVEKERKGVSFGRAERLMGFRGIPSADIFLDEVRVPAVACPGGVVRSCAGCIWTAAALWRSLERVCCSWTQAVTSAACQCTCRTRHFPGGPC